VPGLVPGTHVFLAMFEHVKTWRAGTSPATGAPEGRFAREAQSMAGP
jgi:hypothetical protein